MEKYNEKDGVWRTIGGRRVFIKNGQSVSDAMKESGKFKSASKTKTDTSNNVKEEIIKKDEKEQEEYVKENQPAGEKTRQLIQDSKVKTFADEIKEQEKSSKGNKVVESRKSDYDASSKLDKSDSIKLQMGHGLSEDAVKGYAREQAHGINDKNVNSILSELNDEGSDFTFGDAKIENGKIKTDVSVFMPDERGMVNRELEIPINKEDTNIHSIKAKLRDWQSRHSTPDTFYDKDFSDSAKSTNETMNDAIRVKASRSSLYKSKPESKEIESQGTSNRKEVSNNIQAHILDYYDSPKDFIEQMEAMGTSNMWKAGEEIARGGSYLIYNGDMSDFLDDLKINPKGKKFSEDKAFDMYTSLIGRESARLYEKLKKEESKGRSFNDSLRRKAYEKYLKEHPASKIKFNEFVKNNEK